MPLDTEPAGHQTSATRKDGGTHSDCRCAVDGGAPQKGGGAALDALLDYYGEQLRQLRQSDVGEEEPVMAFRPPRTSK